MGMSGFACSCRGGGDGLEPGYEDSNSEPEDSSESEEVDSDDDEAVAAAVATPRTVIPAAECWDGRLQDGMTLEDAIESVKAAAVGKAEQAIAETGFEAPVDTFGGLKHHTDQLADAMTDLATPRCATARSFFGCPLSPN